MGSKERQKEEINAEEGKNYRVQERWKEGVKGEGAGYASSVASVAAATGSAPRTAPAFVLVQTPAPARSQAATAGLVHGTCSG